MDEQVTRAYGRRAAEYAAALGTVDAMAAPDRMRIEAWADDVDGAILDAGCGPGHWTAHLAQRGHEALGLEPVPEFLEIARREHPGIRYVHGGFDDLRGSTARYGGILAWYSLIHLDPGTVPAALAALHEALLPGGRLLVGFFDGEERSRFDHAVTPAYRWPVPEMVDMLAAAGFAADEIERRRDPGARAHAAIAAHRA